MEKEGKESRRFQERPKMANLLLIEESVSHPLGFREKNWMVSQPRTSALSTTFENPPAMEI